MRWSNQKLDLFDPRRRAWGRVLRVGLAWAAVGLLGGFQDAPGSTYRVSVNSRGVGGFDESRAPAISADGRFVAFKSDAHNLVKLDRNWCPDVFVRDRLRRRTTRVSVSSAGLEGDSTSLEPAISADGRYVVFRSVASNLVPGDTNGSSDVFLHDRETGETTLVTVSSAGVQADRTSEWPGISADGRFVVFESAARNLVPGDTNEERDIFVRDLHLGLTSRVSVDSAGVQANDECDRPVISADGRYVAYESSATNLVAGDTNGFYDIFVHDRLSGETTRVNVSSSAVEADMWSEWPSLSGDGRYVAFASIAGNLVPDDTDWHWDVFVHDRQRAETTRVSVCSRGRQGDLRSRYPSISSDGRYVAFASDARNLVPGDTNRDGDIFVRDRLRGETRRVSVASAAHEANNNSLEPSISAFGRYVAFTSEANNLVPDDTTYEVDVFVRERPLAVARFRNAGTNPSSHAAMTFPVLGSTYVATVDLAGTTGHDFAWLVGYGSAVSHVLGGGQALLVNLLDFRGEFLGLPLASGPVATFDLPVPEDVSFLDFEVITQALHVGGVQPWVLSNAQDLVLGF